MPGNTGRTFILLMALVLSTNASAKQRIALLNFELNAIEMTGNHEKVTQRSVMALAKKISLFIEKLPK